MLRHTKWRAWRPPCSPRWALPILTPIRSLLARNWQVLDSKSWRAMNTKPTNSTTEEAAPAAAEPVAEQTLSWLAALKARLGLPTTPTLRAMLEEALKGASDGRTFSVEEREMLLRILRFGGLRVEDVMVPRADIVAVDENETVWELMKTFDAAGVSRVPLFRETL